jgi:K+-transporting ATPase KdpF subunit
LFTPSLWAASTLGATNHRRVPAHGLGEPALLALVAVVALVGYLVYTLIRPERF